MANALRVLAVLTEPRLADKAVAALSVGLVSRTPIDQRPHQRCSDLDGLIYRKR